MDNVRLSKEQYWKWRCYIAEMQTAEAHYNKAQHQYGQMLKDIEISRLNALLFQKSNMSALEEKHTLCKKDYEEVKAEVEKELGMSLNGCVIDDVTHEVKKIEE